MTKTLTVSLLALTCAAPAFAQSNPDQPTTDERGDTIVVTASRSGDAVPIKQLGASVTVLDAEALDTRQTRIVSDILRDVPGVAVSRTGAIGGEALIADMDRDLARLAGDTAAPLRVAAWDGSGFSGREGSLLDNLFKAAGAVNVRNLPPASGYGRPDVEVLLATAPDLLVNGAGVGRKPGLTDNIERHRLVRRYWDGARTLTIPQAYYVCGTPMVGKAALRLPADLRAAAASVATPLPFAALAAQ